MIYRRHLIARRFSFMIMTCRSLIEFMTEKVLCRGAPIVLTCSRFRPLGSLGLDQESDALLDHIQAENIPFGSGELMLLSWLLFTNFSISHGGGIHRKVFRQLPSQPFLTSWASFSSCESGLLCLIFPSSTLYKVCTGSPAQEQ
jgi:hypothetical protein